MNTASVETTLTATADTAALVDRRALLKREIAERTKELDAINAQLIKAGPGEYLGTDGEASVKVISPAPSVQMPKDSKAHKANKEATAAIKAIIEDEDTFKKLFWFVGGYIVAKDFRTKAAVLLTPARLQKVLAIVETPGTSYVA